jgi:hypothetical protein
MFTLLYACTCLYTFGDRVCLVVVRIWLLEPYGIKCIRMNIQVLTCVYYMRRYAHNTHKHKHTHTHTHTHTQVLLQGQSKSGSPCSRVICSMYVCMYICIYIYIIVYTSYIHTCTQTHTHTHRPGSSGNLKAATPCGQAICSTNALSSA